MRQECARGKGKTGNKNLLGFNVEPPPPPYLCEPQILAGSASFYLVVRRVGGLEVSPHSVKTLSALNKNPKGHLPRIKIKLGGAAGMKYFSSCV